MQQLISCKKRESNLELLRIIGMFGVILSHYQFFLFDLMRENTTSNISMYHYILSSFGKIGINVFMLITGYFMCTQEISKYKFIKLLCQIYFYNIIIGSILMLTGNMEISFSRLLHILFPFRNISFDSFCTAFIWYFLFIPYVSILVKGLSQKMHLRLIILSLIVYVGYHTLSDFNVIVSPITWFSILLIISSYYRFYLEEKIIYQKRILFLIFICSFICSCLSILYLLIFKGSYFPYQYSGEANSIFSLIVAVSLFVFMKSIMIRYNKCINLLGGAAFGVLLIHSNCPEIRDILYNKLIDTRYWFAENSFLAPVIFSTIIYLVCAIIEIIRQKYIENKYLPLVLRILSKQ